MDDIVSFADGAQLFVEQLRIQCGLPSRGLDAVGILTDKVLFKSHPAVQPYIAQHLEIDPVMSKDEAVAMVMSSRLRFPVVVKPSNGFYSAGVVRADNVDELKRAYVQARRVCTTLAARAGASRVIVEKYLDGNEFAVDGFIVNDKVRPLLLHRKRPRLEGPTFHETAYLTERFDSERGTEALEMLERIVAGVGLRNSPFHAEFRFDADGRLYVLEVAPRLAGSGATTQRLMMVCIGLDAYECLHGTFRSSLDLTPKRDRIGLEYDFGPEATGILCNVAEVAAACEQRGATSIIRYRSDGDLVLGPPNNVECILTAFFDCTSLSVGQALFDDIANNCHIKTESK
ncbi:ATP-grasp domain-containing protein [Chromobacterium phragmitis]|nr:ATP-grasp domain-containing protein [Chromobacterium phragmitis]